MKLFLPKYPVFLKLLYPGRITRLKDSKAIYLTFDDGPVPEITPWVLDLLNEYHAKASFFCIGDNVKKYPEIFQRIISEGHAVGNHTFNHLNGWNSNNSQYYENTWKAEEILSKTSNEKIQESASINLNAGPNFPLFRPPYGRIKNQQAVILNAEGFKIVMWDVISGDYDESFSAEKCLQNVLKNAVAGSTIVFHDSKKAFKNLEVILPKILEYYSEKGMEFKSLKDVL